MCEPSQRAHIMCEYVPNLRHYMLHVPISSYVIISVADLSHIAEVSYVSELMNCLCAGKLKGNVSSCK